MMLGSCIKTKTTILTDCFDTVIHRREHPFLVIKRWANCVSRLYPNIAPNELYKERMKLSKTGDKTIETEGIYFVYEQLAKKYILLGKIEERLKEKFVTDCKRLEIKCESAVIYGNRKMIRYLQKCRKYGKKIYCVSDYHFNGDDMKEILFDVGILNLFDGIFSSAEYGVTKEKGKLYEVVLSELKIKEENCLMIGDNKKSDFINARKYGISAKYRPHELRRCYLALCNRNNKGFNADVGKIGKLIYKASNSYEEYVTLFYTFCVRLYHRISEENGKRVVFLAREGYFLRKCFEIYQSYCIPEADRIETEYLKCSRRAIHSVQKDKCRIDSFCDISVKNYFRSIGFEEGEIKSMISSQMDIEKIIHDFPKSEEAKVIINDISLQKKIKNRMEENQIAFNEYVHQKVNGKILNLVDIGWTGRMQLGIDKLFDDIHTRGFYMGVMGNPDEVYCIEKEGLIFNLNKDEMTRYSGIFRANTQLYEQLTAAPHGSACFYRKSCGGVTVIEEWNDKEKDLYNRIIQGEQEKLLKWMEKLCVLISEDKVESKGYNRSLAKVKLKSDLIQSKKRLDFMKALSEGFIQNFQNETIGLKYEEKIKINPINILYTPLDYVRYFAKLGLVLEKRGLYYIARLINRLFYWYCCVRM